MMEQCQFDYSLNRSSQLPMLTGKHYIKDQSLSAVKLFDEYKISNDFKKPVNFVVFSPFENSYDILACSTQERVYIFRILLSTDNDGDDSELNFDYECIYDYLIGSKCTCITFSPKTDFSQLKNNFLSLAVACEDFAILLLNHTFNGVESSEEYVQQQYIIGHSDFVNDFAFEPTFGNSLASTSDDCTCCVWSLANNGQKNIDMKIILSSPGINVKWHKSEPHKVC